MQVNARVDYAIRALAELASKGQLGATKAELAERQTIPGKFLETILSDLTRAGLLVSQRGHAGGYLLARSADMITLADIVRAVDGPLAAVRGAAPEDANYSGAAAGLRDIWIALRASLRRVLETTTLSQLARGDHSPEVRDLLTDESVWLRRQ